MTKPHPLIPVTLLTGFLGSGKTTVLNQLLQQPEMARALVIINEFGEIGLDHLLVAHSSDEAVTEMSSGCLCCTIRQDLVKTLRDITWRFARQGKRAFDRVVIETTGLADPVPILHTLMTNSFMIEHYRLGGVVTVVDLAHAEKILDTHPEALKQIAVADCLLLTKEDLALSQASENLAQRLRNINPAARQVRASQGRAAAGDILNVGFGALTEKSPDIQGWMTELASQEASLSERAAHHMDLNEESSRHHHRHDANRHNEQIRAYSFVIEEPIDEDRLQIWSDQMATMMGDQMLRIKAVINITGKSRPLVLHGVQNLFYPSVYLQEWPSDDKRSRFVFITRAIDKAAIENTFIVFS